MKNLICEIRIGNLTVKFGADAEDAEETVADEEDDARTRFLRTRKCVGVSALRRVRLRNGWLN